jgi:hypothetical protein
MEAHQHYRGGAKEYQCRLGASKAAAKQVSRRITFMMRTLIYDGLGYVKATAAERSMRCPDEP